MDSRSLNRLVVGCAIALIAVTAAMQVVIPIAYERVVARALRSEVAMRHLSVDVVSFPAAEMLFGTVDKLFLEARGIAGEGIAIESAEVVMTDIRLGLGPAKTPEIRYIGGGHGLVSIRQDAINDYIIKAIGIDAVRVEFEDGRVVLTGTLEFAGESTRIAVGCQLKPRDGGIGLLPEGLPSIIADKLTVVLPLDILPIPLEVTAVRVDEGRLMADFVPSPVHRRR